MAHRDPPVASGIGRRRGFPALVVARYRARFSYPIDKILENGFWLFPMTREEATALVYGNPEAAIELILQLVATVERLTARVEELERKIALLTRDSSNSSKPPSSDGPAAKPKARPPMKSKKRKPGGQPGHKGTNRDLIPTEEVDEVIPVFPETCDHCGAVLTPERSRPADRQILASSGH